MEPVFVGREPEMRILVSALEHAASGRGGLVLVAGEPGIGKSRLLDEFAHEAAAAGAVVAWGRSWEAGGAPSYWIWAEALRAVVAALGRPWWEVHGEPWAHELADVLPEAATNTPAAPAPVTPPTDASDPAEARFRLFAATTRLLEAACAVQPVVVLLDDLHVADAASALLLRFLVRQAHASRLLLVGTYRDVELTTSHPFTATLERLLRDTAVTRVALRPLDPSDVAQMVEAAIGAPPPGDLAERVWFHTDGNPLYVREVVQLVVTEGPPGHGRDETMIPRDLRATILQRVAGLPSECIGMLEVASVLGRDVPIDVLADAACEADPLAALEPAVATGVIGERADAPGQLRFSHVVVRDALYDELPAGRRAHLHRRVGESLEVRRRADLANHVTELALHFAAAAAVGEHERAVHYCRLAGDRAMRLLAFDDAARLYGRSLAVADLSAPDAPETRLELLLQLAEAQARGGATSASKGTYLAAASLARELDRPHDLARAAHGYGGRIVWLRAGSDHLVITLLREALDALDALGERDDALRSRLLARLSGALRDDPDPSERDRLSEQAVRLADACGDAELKAYARTARYTAIWGPDVHEELAHLAAEAEELAQRSGVAERISDAGWLRFVAAIAAGDAETCHAIAERQDRIAVELRQPSQRWHAGVMRSVLGLMEGPLHDAEASIEETFAAGIAAQGWDAHASYRLALALLRWEQGRLPELEGLLVRSLVEYPGYPLFRCLLALAVAEAGRHAAAVEQARAVIDDGALPRDNGWLFGMATLAQVAADTRDVDLAARLYPALLPFGHLVSAAAGEVSGGSVSRPLGNLATVLGRHDDAARHFDDARACHERTGATVWEAHTLYDHAVMLARRGTAADTAEAARLLERALTICTRMGMARVADRITSLGVAPAPRRRGEPRPGGLTAREVDVAALVARGLSNRGIAAELIVSERTVETHVENILRKLGLTSRTQVAAWMVANGSRPAT